MNGNEHEDYETSQQIIMKKNKNNNNKNYSFSIFSIK